MELRMNYGKHVLAGLLLAVLMSACGGGKDLSGVSSTDAGSSRADGSTSNDSTTYQLKLLLQICTDISNDSTCSETSTVITSYSIHYTKLYDFSL